MKLIIITVVKDNLEALKRTYASLVSQTRQDFKWLVQEGVSTDGTLEWLRSLSYPNLELHSERDKSIHNAMNLAIKKVPHGHCMFLNAGDTYYSDEVLERILTIIDRGDVPFAYGKYIIGGVPGFPARILGEKITGAGQVLRGRVPCHQTMVIERGVFDSFGFYDESLGIFSDRDWILGYVKAPEWRKSVYLDFPVVHYDPVGRSYYRFIAKWRLYLSMLRKRGGPVEILIGIFGWARTAGYIALSMLLDRSKGAGSHAK